MDKLIIALLFIVFAYGCQGQQVEEILESVSVSEMVKYSDLEFKETNGENLAYQDGQLFTGWSVVYTKGETRYIEQQYANGKKDGVWRIYFPSGQLHKEGTMRDGKDHGRYREYHPNGKMQYEYYYDLGKKTGKWLSWYENGVPYTERHFVNDQLHGKVYVWDEQGNLAKEYDYRNSVLVNSKMHFKEGQD
jgi:antitoxin component YwqK of YwqJK toxin-antitoxin module